MMVQLLITNQTIYRVRPATAELQQSSQTAQIKLQHSVTQSTIKLALTFYLPVLSRPERQRYDHVYSQCTLIKWLSFEKDVKIRLLSVATASVVPLTVLMIAREKLIDARSSLR